MKKLSFFMLSLLMANACHPFRGNVKATTHLGPFSFNLIEDLSENFVITVATVALLSKIGYDVSWHSVYNMKSQDWYQRLETTIDQHDIKTIHHPKLYSLFSPTDHDEILQMHVWICSAYSNWFTPWNWTPSLKASFEKLQIIEILTVYADLFAKKDDLTGQEIVKAFRSKYSSTTIYPLLFAYDNIDRHIQLIKSLNNYYLKALLWNAIEPLNNIKILLRQENDYQQEVTAKRAHDLQKELIQATYSSACRR